MAPTSLRVEAKAFQLPAKSCVIHIIYAFYVIFLQNFLQCDIFLFRKKQKHYLKEDSRNQRETLES